MCLCTERKKVLLTSYSTLYWKGKYSGYRIAAARITNIVAQINKYHSSVLRLPNKITEMA